MKIRSLFSSVAAIAVLASTALGQVYGPSTNLNIPASRPLKGDVVAGQDYSVTGPTTSGYIYALPTSQATSNTLTASSATTNAAATLSLAAPPAGKSWVFSGVQFTLAGGTPGTLLAGSTSFGDASGTTAMANGDTVKVTVGSAVYTYTFRTAVAAYYDVQRSATFDTNITNLANAINAIGGTNAVAGTYFVPAANPFVTAAAVSSHATAIKARFPGTWSNAIGTTVGTNTGSGVWTATTINGGTPGTGALFTIQDGTYTDAGGVTLIPNIVYALGFGVSAGNEKVSFNPPLKCGPADAVTLNLSAGGSSVYGILNANAYQQ